MKIFFGLLVLCSTARYSTATPVCTWKETDNYHIIGGTLTAATTVPQCQSDCIASNGCQSVDWDTGTSKCYLLYTQSGLVAFQGVNHYDKICTDPCSPNPCQNGGTCSNSGTIVSCSCPSGWTGSTCQTVYNPCSSNPCQNGGSCSANGATAVCTCPPPWTGSNCQTYVNPCSSNPCQNGGSCSASGATATCTCPPPWTGSNCQTYVNPCSSNPCQNGGSCSASGATATCTCPPPWSGSTCQTYVNPCSSNPCQNGGSCSASGATATCNCPVGWTGSYCQTRVDPCSSGPCRNGGQCFSSGNTYMCNCPTGFSGTSCEYANPCNINPCQNGGQCTQGNPPNTYSCSCSAGWTGANCETSTCRKLDLMKDPNAGRCLSTSYSGGASGLISPIGGISWTFGIASFTIDWPAQSFFQQQITSIEFTGLGNAAFMRVNFLDSNGGAHWTDPITSSPYKPTNINAGPKLTISLMPIDFTQNVSISGLKIFYCTPGILGCWGNTNVFGNSGGLFGAIVGLVSLGIIKIGSDGAVSWSSRMDIPYFEADLNCLGYGVSEINKVQVNQVNNIGMGGVKIWLQNYPVTVTNNYGLVTEQFSLDPAAPGVLTYNFAAGLKGDRVRVLLYPSQNSAQSASLTVWFQSASIFIC